MMKKKGDTKRQHYVPQFILRNFSADEANVGVLVLHDGKVVPSGPIKTQAYGDYFYGADQIFEKAFGVAETDIARRLSDLTDDVLNSLGSDDLQQLKLFVHYQLFRTKAAVEQQDQRATALARQVMSKVPLESGLSPSKEMLEALRVTHEDGPAQALEMATRVVPLTQDLHLRLLRTKHQEKFVIGDHPVALYNQFAEHHPVLGMRGRTTALAARGLQVLMPISSSLCIFAFDAARYALTSKHLVCNVGLRDVRAINQMQAVNAWKCVFFDQRHTGEKALRKLMDTRAKHVSIHETTVNPFGHVSEENAGQFTEVLMSTAPDIRIGAHFSFLRVVDQHHYRDHTSAGFPTRLPPDYLRAFLDVHEEVLNEHIAEARESGDAREPA